MEDFKEFLELSAEQYNTKYGGKKGNVTLTSFDGHYKAMLTISEQITFDERLQVAKGLIDNCIHRWSEGTRGEMVVLVQNAFQVDKSGKINRENVLGLRRLKIDDDEWKQAMEAITDSVQVVSTKPHLRFYERGSNGKYKQISVDFSSL